MENPKGKEAIPRIENRRLGESPQSTPAQSAKQKADARGAQAKIADGILIQNT